MRFATLLFDLDDTLYPASTGLWSLLKKRMSDYMRERLGIPEEQIQTLREQYFLQFGTTLRGLQAYHHVDTQDFLAYVHDAPLSQYLTPNPIHVDTQDFLAYVHDAPLSQYLTPNPIQREVLAALPGRKLIFTNADVPHAQRVLAALKLEGLFDGIVDVNAVSPYCKPMPESFEIALKAAGESDPACCVMIDDLPRTTRAAMNFGLYGILFGQPGPHPDADACFDDWSKLPELLV
jgi:putative hydrolase of the HAD superfamily